MNRDPSRGFGGWPFSPAVSWRSSGWQQPVHWLHRLFLTRWPFEGGVLGADLLVAFAFLGPFIPILLAIYRRPFLRLRRSLQWAAAVGLPAAYLVALLSADRDASAQADQPLKISTLKVHVKPAGAIDFDVSTHFMRQGGASSIHPGQVKGGAEFVYFFRTGLMVELTGTMIEKAPDGVEIAGELEIQGETVRLQVDGLTEVVITVDGEPKSEPVYFGGTVRRTAAGETHGAKYKFVIKGRLKGQ